MTPSESLAWIRRTRIVPVIRASSSDEALEAIEALLEAGIDVLEITMTVPGAIALVAEVARRHGDHALVGAGTVLDAETAWRCIDAGAQFIVSPALDLGTIATCRDLEVAVAPGALTPTEIVAAWKAGADVVKVFPCDALGGASYIKSLKAPLPEIPLLPTGGVTLANARSFLDAGAEAVGVGSNLVDLSLLRSGRRSEFVDRARAFCSAVAGA